jgi:predicted dehydrogenase
MGIPLRIGILGAAGIAKVAVVPAIEGSRNARVVALATRDPERGAEWARSLGLALVPASYEAVIADRDVDAVYIPLPNSHHAEWTIRAARAGKAVLCEKPLARTAAEAEAAIRACAESGVVLMEGFMYRFHPQHARVRELIAAGAIGDVVEVQAHLSVDLMSPIDPSNVRFKPELGGGALLDMGCYVVHIARNVFGEEPAAVLGRWTVDPGFGVDVEAAGVLEFSNGRVALVSCSFRGNGQGFYRVVGRRGLIDVPRAIIPGLGERIAETVVTVVDANGAREDMVMPPVDQYRLMIEAFADAVAEGRRQEPTASDSVANMLALDAFAQSAREGRRVRIRR